jgi:O-antigen ligase
MNAAQATVAPAAPGKRVPASEPVRNRQRTIRRRVGVAWGLLVLNALTYYGSILPIPSTAGKLITQGALPLMLLVALTVNRRAVIRPNVFLSLVSLLALEAIITTLQPQHVGTVYRALRLLEFVAGLWLLTPWWGRRDLLLVRCYLISLSVALGSVVLGLLFAPGSALSGGRLGGVLWGIPATEVGHYSAVIMGLAIVLWLGGMMSGKRTLLVSIAAMALLLLSHTRTALIALVASLLVAGLSMIVVRARVRRFFAITAIVVSIGVMTTAGVVTEWLARGQSAQQLSSLTGRTDFWSLVLNMPRNRFQEIFGFGLSNGSVNGLPIDSNWLVAYLEQGLIGVVVCVAIVLFLLVAAFFQPPSTKRALALFLITYSIVASFTQVGFANPTTYLLELTLAASLLMPPVTGRRPR